MRLLIQRVSEAKVDIDEKTVGQIEQGLLVLLGITHEDTDEDVEWLVRKLLGLRIFEDEEGRMNLSVKDVGGGVLVVSQFTLFANTKKGNRPSFIRSAPPETATPIYERFLDVLRVNFSGPVATGEFGGDMKVSLINDGPVTIMIDSQQRDF
ncbi:UNVERIFIED_CONTAM: hypothetical protein GTU68_012543 [Idotea baltica]|nr:hypothetical protein [Idotea baltica]